MDTLERRAIALTFGTVTMTPMAAPETGMPPAPSALGRAVAVSGNMQPAIPRPEQDAEPAQKCFSPIRLFRTILIYSSADYCLRVARALMT